MKAPLNTLLEATKSLDAMTGSFCKRRSGTVPKKERGQGSGEGPAILFAQGRVLEQNQEPQEKRLNAASRLSIMVNRIPKATAKRLAVTPGPTKRFRRKIR
ncbi:hypothetical protein MTO96_025302 [Rhipicephalus appendiculatus]